ncbi:hypothetical protein HYX58_00595 [Candidatus Dependentiae bacterium]|nr:hypothetical protein [Candidatus Dependentiae bacterium]
MQFKFFILSLILSLSSVQTYLNAVQLARLQVEEFPLANGQPLTGYGEGENIIDQNNNFYTVVIRVEATETNPLETLYLKRNTSRECTEMLHLHNAPKYVRIKQRLIHEGVRAPEITEITPVTDEEVFRARYEQIRSRLGKIGKEFKLSDGELFTLIKATVNDDTYIETYWKEADAVYHKNRSFFKYDQIEHRARLNPNPKEDVVDEKLSTHWRKKNLALATACGVAVVYAFGNFWAKR